MYLEPKFQPSLRINPKIISFDLLDEKFIKDNIINAPLIFEENEIKDIPLEELLETNNLIIPCIADDAFIDKSQLDEPISGKNFNEIYKSYLLTQNEKMEGEKEELKNEIFMRTMQRKLLLKIYLNRMKKKENKNVLTEKNQTEERIDMDKLLVKVRGYRKKMDKKIKEKKEQLKKEEEFEEIEDDDDWIDNKILKEEN